jgi:hypothetical protein
MKENEEIKEEIEKEKLPLDARLLSEAIIEFNISRRSVGLYPPDHTIIVNSIDKAYELLDRILEMRTNITLDIVEDELVIDEYILDRENPVYAECALSFHDREISAVTFTAGLDREDIVKLHELLTTNDEACGRELVELAQNEGLSHIQLSPIDHSKSKSINSAGAKESRDEEAWEDYVYALLEGKLSDDDLTGLLSGPSPEKMAAIINESGPERTTDQAYDRVITSYLKSKGESKLNPESMDKLVTLMNSLTPDIKRKFLSKMFGHVPTDTMKLEGILKEMTSESFESMVKLFEEQYTSMPEALKNAIDKLRDIKPKGLFGFDLMIDKSAFVHDIEIDESIIRLFNEDNFSNFVSEDYKDELARMANATRFKRDISIKEFRSDFDDEVVDKVTSEIMVEVLNVDIITRENYLKVMKKLTELAKVFVQTGRFEEALNIYNSLYSHALSGRFRHEASSSIKYFFQTEEFLAELIESARIWGSSNRNEIVRLARMLKGRAIPAMIDALLVEQDTSLRKFFLLVLTELGNDVVDLAIKNLNDDRWYVIRNMVYLIRECGSKKYVNYVRKFAKHSDARIAMEALKTLIHFKTVDSIQYLKVNIQSEDYMARDHAIKLANAYKVRETVPDLVEVLQKKGVLPDTKVSVIRALGGIGDSSAIKPLTDLYKVKSWFLKGSVEQIKEEIFRNLYNYPPPSVKSLIEMGRRSKNDNIRKMSEQLMSDMFLKKKPGRSD